ncbi:recombinase family protein [Neobacillus novalis]|uniref:recombinase family protein n=1 Tax=Neobacillus novalis TaxID=220687 RepID=UPI003CC7C54D
MSRISRTLPISLKLVKEINKANVRFISIFAKFGTPDGIFNYNLLECVSEYMRKEHSERVKMGLAYKRANS